MGSLPLISRRSMKNTTRASIARCAASCSTPGWPEDLTQDAFVRAYVKWDTYQGNGPVAAWLYRTVNHALSHLRRPRLSALVTRIGQSLLNGGHAPDPQTMVTDRMDVTEALALLAPQQRAALVLYYYQGYSYREIAQVLGVAEGTVGASLNAAQAVAGSAQRSRDPQPGGARPGSGGAHGDDT